MEEVKEVVQIASEYLKNLVDQAQNVRLEQVEESLGISKWSVILSYPDETSSLAASIMASAGVGRIFKEVVVDSKQKRATALRVWKQ